jgi:hypothetical protein
LKVNQKIEESGKAQIKMAGRHKTLLAKVEGEERRLKKNNRE